VYTWKNGDFIAFKRMISYGNVHPQDAHSINRGGARNFLPGELNFLSGGLSPPLAPPLSINEKHTWL